MPIPKPTTTETEDKFISRCMGDNTMSTEYPDESQRYAVCKSSYDTNNYKKSLLIKEVEKIKKKNK